LIDHILMGGRPASPERVEDRTPVASGRRSGSRGTPGQTAVVVVGLALFWLTLFWAGYPLPQNDDLFHIGAAEHLAEGGAFTNPYIREWTAAFPTTHFYYYPPFHSFILAAWLRAVGLSTKSLLAFQCLIYLGFSLSSFLLLRSLRLPALVTMMPTFVFAAWHCNPIYGTGLRPDALGMALLTAGLWLLTEDRFSRCLTGAALMIIAAVTAPVAIAYALPLGGGMLAIGYSHQAHRREGRRQWLASRSAAVLIAAATVAIAFLVCIQFQARTFAASFLLHASMRRVPVAGSIPQFLKLITQYYNWLTLLPTYVLAIVAAGTFFRRRSRICAEWQVVVGSLCAGIGLNVLLYSSAVGFTYFIAWVTSGIALFAVSGTLGSRWKKGVLASVAVAAFGVSQVQAVIALASREYPDSGAYETIRRATLSDARRTYAIDTVAARFVFDYQLPPGSISWEYSTPGSYPHTIAVKKPDTTWVVSAPAMGVFVPGVIPDYPRVRFLGRRFNSLPKRPFDVVIVQ
jgi:hypothetical protein